ncbi:MAG: hypothetical protein JWO83_5137 [Caulobacteraceae bacterium]|jgi:hypothetical protein|nr:hypothetical protein [Caulobacteraceae bacterium]
MTIAASLRQLGAVAMAAAAITTLGGLDAGPTLTYNPKHYQNNDPQWEVLNRTQIVADTAKGEYKATFPAALVARKGAVMKISGFILPLETTSRSAHFMLVRRNTGCPFCPPNAPTEAVEIFSRQPVRYTGEEIAVTGRLKLVPSSDQGLFFQLADADVVGPQS